LRKQPHMMRYGCGVFLFAFVLAACGGGGGGGGTTPTTTTPQTTPTITPPTTTNASGTVVDDANGTPLSGVNVALEPWTAGATPLPSPQATTNASGGFTLNAVPDGHYLLVIGSNSPSDTTYTTVHDNVTLSGGNQTLVAPTLPAVHAYTPPTWETNGDYRISKLDATTELPCFQRFNSDRVSAGVSQLPLDEWSLESAHAVNADRNSASPTLAAVISSRNTSVSYGAPGTYTAACNYMADSSFPPAAGAYAQDTKLGWYGGSMLLSTSGTTYLGVMYAPYDPRVYADPGYPWP
jgi:hypothetical protein